MSLYRMVNEDGSDEYVMAHSMTDAIEAWRAMELREGEPEHVSFISDEAYIDEAFIQGNEAPAADAQSEHLSRKIERMEKAIRRALGRYAGDDVESFSSYQPDDPKDRILRPYWWRKHLREMSGVD